MKTKPIKAWALEEMKPYKELTDQEFADWCAKIFGWNLNIVNEEVLEVWEDKDGQQPFFNVCKDECDSSELWNPTHSLDQCFVFEEWLIKHDYTAYCSYTTLLKDDIHATADQRCEAFYETMKGRL